MIVPDASIERRLLSEGVDLVVGVDEVGRGAWAGPLAIGAVALRPEVLLRPDPAAALGGLRDSKAIAEPRRASVAEAVLAASVAHGVGYASAAECDAHGMAAALRLAAARALEGLVDRLPDASVRLATVLDGPTDFLPERHAAAVRGARLDATCVSVAAAAIVAKVTRDALMREASLDLPWWSFESNKGYPCAKHRAGLVGFGPSSIHRRSWVFVDNVVPWLATSARSR